MATLTDTSPLAGISQALKKRCMSRAFSRSGLKCSLVVPDGPPAVPFRDERIGCEPVVMANFGQTYFGQTDFGQFLCFSVLAKFVGCWLLVVGCWLLVVWTPPDHPPTSHPPPDRQNFALFLPFPITVSLSLCLSGCLLVEFWCCLKRRSPQINVHVWSSRFVV